MLIKDCQRAIFDNFSSESGLPGTLQVAGHFFAREILIFPWATD